METRKHTGGSWQFGAYAQNRLRGIKRPDISGDSQLIECKAHILCTTL